MAHAWKHQREKPKSGTLKVFARLFRTFARQYWPILLVGVVSALLVGGAQKMIFEAVQTAVESVDRGKEERPASGREKAVAAPSEEAKAAQAPQSESEDAKKARKLIGKANRWLTRFGLKPLEETDKLSLRLTAVLIAGFFFAVTGKTLLELINRWSLKWLGARIVTDMRNALFRRLLDQSMGYFSRGEVGKLISRCTNDINVVEVVIATAFPELCVEPIIMLVSVYFIYDRAVQMHMGWDFLLLLLLLPLFLVPMYLLSRLLKRYQAKVLAGISTVTSRMQECFSGVQVIKAFNQEKREGDRFQEVNESYFRKLRKAIAADVFIHPTMAVAAVLMACIFLLLCFREGITIPMLFPLMMAAQAAYKPIKDLTKLNAHLQKAAAAAERVFEVVDLDTTLPVPANPRPITAFHERIVYHDVSFRYTADGEQVLEHIDLEIPKGALVALVGQTGSGKSTIANLLARFYDPSEGHITIDGIDLKEFAPGDFRRQVGIVSQDTFLFNTTIAENIRYGRPEATDAEVEEAARLANVTEFVGQWPEGYRHLVGERGNLLSGGQKQRIAIARAILRNPPILILDEATSALDTVTEQLVQEALNNVMKDRTVLAIAHRLSTIKSADEIIVLEQGRILERGTHQQLLERNGRYRQLNDMQFKEEHS